MKKTKKKTRDQKFPNDTICNLYSDFVYTMYILNEIFLQYNKRIIKIITECQFIRVDASYLLFRDGSYDVYISLLLS